MVYSDYSYGYPEDDDIYSPAFGGFGYRSTHIRYDGLSAVHGPYLQTGKSANTIGAGC